MTEDEATKIDSVIDLLTRTELTEIRTYLLHGERAERAESSDAQVSISARAEPALLEVRCRMVVETEDADLIVDRSALFTHSEPVALGKDAVREFVEKVGVMSVYPYLREGIFTLANNLGVSPPVMALMRAGGIQLSTDPQHHQSPGKSPEDVKPRHRKPRRSTH